MPTPRCRGRGVDCATPILGAFSQRRSDLVHAAHTATRRLPAFAASAIHLPVSRALERSWVLARADTRYLVVPYIISCFLADPSVFAALEELKKVDFALILGWRKRGD
ncbi:hypothetical protein B0H11DRAFT_2291094 [Mycena galericulata]|nr:hypothetical protein B0H11DRAFT_2291094 [Mycena galericulata]